MKKFASALILMCVAFVASSQVHSFNYKYERHKFNKSLIYKLNKNKVLIRNINDNEQFEGSYLGKIKTRHGQVFYLVNSSYVFNIKSLAKTENHIFIYNYAKQFVGYYYLSQMCELPNNLVNNKLTFKIEGCEEKIIINLYYGIPRAINLGCHGKNNFYEFLSK